jgi:hypothetical protein
MNRAASSTGEEKIRHLLKLRAIGRNALRPRNFWDISFSCDGSWH